MLLLQPQRDQNCYREQLHHLWSADEHRVLLQRRTEDIYKHPLGSFLKIKIKKCGVIWDLAVPVGFEPDKHQQQINNLTLTNTVGTGDCLPT